MTLNQYQVKTNRILPTPIQASAPVTLMSTENLMKARKQKPSPYPTYRLDVRGLFPQRSLARAHLSPGIEQPSWTRLPMPSLTVVLNYSTLSTQLRASLSDVMNADEAERGRFHKHVIHTLQEMVCVATDAARCAQQAIVAHIGAVTAARPGLTRAHIDYRRDQLIQLSTFRDNTFFQSILSDIMTIRDQGRTAVGRPREDCYSSSQTHPPL
ncbi:hypothetical protein BC939DRAFT_54681 [Gamsiella multidivaricata]|uniref:uncharacterized protein n=1 Tax=Gamsiella multidivaricata TaxID=101098 RepID=UPI00221EE18A|nr:uncharacterized protein BC939DRAFT_54681 [Gamsiella multidivaricata]KAI7816248.1 hypothetical protein BC939DRAFT_54681 [Gamsiella multidivaricata]